MMPGDLAELLHSFAKPRSAIHCVDERVAEISSGNAVRQHSWQAMKR